MSTTFSLRRTSYTQQRDRAVTWDACDDVTLRRAFRRLTSSEQTCEWFRRQACSFLEPQGSQVLVCSHILCCAGSLHEGVIKVFERISKSLPGEGSGSSATWRPGGGKKRQSPKLVENGVRNGVCRWELGIWCPRSTGTGLPLTTGPLRNSTILVAAR